MSFTTMGSTTMELHYDWLNYYVAPLLWSSTTIMGSTTMGSTRKNINIACICHTLWQLITIGQTLSSHASCYSTGKSVQNVMFQGTETKPPRGGAASDWAACSARGGESPPPPSR